MILFALLFLSGFSAKAGDIPDNDDSLFHTPIQNKKKTAEKGNNLFPRSIQIAGIELIVFGIRQQVKIMSDGGYLVHHINGGTGN